MMENIIRSLIIFLLCSKIEMIEGGKCTAQLTNPGAPNIRIHCYNIETFPVITDNRTLVDVIRIERSRLSVPNIGDYYPRLSELVLDNCLLEGGINQSTFLGLTALKRLTFYWTPLSLLSLSNVLCSTEGINMELFLKGIFQKELITLTQDSVRCLSTSDITRLDFSSNTVEPGSVLTLLCAVSHSLRRIRIGKLMSNYPLRLESDSFRCLQDKVNLTFIEISSTWVKGITNESLRHLQHAKILDFYHAAGYISLNVFDSLDHLEHLYLGQNAYRDLRVFTDDSITARLNNLRLLNLEQNSFALFYPFNEQSLPLLETLILSRNHPVIQNIPDHFISNLHKLRILFMDDSRIGSISEKAFLSKSLEVLNLDRVVINLDHLPLSVFSYMENLKNISINHLNREFPQPGNYDGLIRFCRYAFQNLPKLEILRLRYVGLLTIYKDMFLNTTNLREVDLSNNQLDTIQDASFYSMMKLSKLVLNSNNLVSLNSTMLPMANGSLYLEVSFNPFVCDCQLYEFRQWLNNTTNIKFPPERAQRYTCTNGKGGLEQKVIDFKPTYTQCFTHSLSSLYMAIASGTSILTTIVLVSSLITRFRWHFHYCYIRARARGRQYQELEDTTGYKYDAFVSYNRHDTPWVVHTLRPVLEDTYKMCLCLHDRDWLAGGDIVDNIIDSIENSRKVVLVVSNAFAASNWCQLELTMAQHRLFSQDRSNLILILKEEVVDALMTPRLALQMRERTYIPWGKGEIGRAVFWERLVHAIKGPMSSVRHSVPQDK